MAGNDTNLAERSGSLLESHKGYDPRIVFFYLIVAALLLALAGGLGYEQLVKSDTYAERERKQNQRRVLFPGPRGNIYDRNGTLLVGNNHRFTVMLHLDELKTELRREQLRIYKAFVQAEGKKGAPTPGQLSQLARISLVQRYLDQVNALIGRDEKVRPKELESHFQRQLLLPYKLLDNLGPEEYARLIEGIPVNSPLEVYTSNVRAYPHGSAAAHTLGYVQSHEEFETDGLPGEDLTTFKMPGTRGRAGLEKTFDEHLEGKAGGRIYRVDPNGYRISQPLEERKPVQGKHLVTSLDIDLQLAAEARLQDNEMAGSAVAIDIATGEVLVLASKPDYDLNQFSPRIASDVWKQAEERGAFLNRAIQGTYPPGSTFKILTTIAGLRSGHITPTTVVDCHGVYHLGRGRFDCHDRHAHGETQLVRALEKSCNVYYYTTGNAMGPDLMAQEARRFRLDQPTGIELPFETSRMIVPDPEWKYANRKERWVGGDTVQTAIGQGLLLVSPLQMACFMASVARNEVWTQPTLLHDPSRPRVKSQSIGLTPDQRNALLSGLEQVTRTGTAKILTENKLLPLIPGLRIGAKTGTAQKHSEKGMINFAWLVAFAPIENPQIAIAVIVEGDTPGEETGGGRYASPVAHSILKTWVDKKNRTAVSTAVRLKSE
jgi:penicillin-binding protein 2